MIDVHTALRALFRVRKYFLRIGIRGPVILNFGPESGLYLDILWPLKKNMLLSR
jgi:hypothetical protein